MASIRKGSLKYDRTIDLSEKSRKPDSSRERKNSANISRPSMFEEIQGNLNMNLQSNKNFGCGILDERTANKLVFLKRLEKLEKEAIKYFYDNQIESCFDCLEKCLTMIEERKSSCVQGEYGPVINFP